MKSLSIKQPWAWAILGAGKDIENRTFNTKHRGPLLIHTGKEFDFGAMHWIIKNKNKLGLDTVPFLQNLPRGGFVGRVELVDVVNRHESPWFFGPSGFVLRDPVPCSFMEYPGQLGFFNVSSQIIKSLKFTGE